MRYSIRSDTPSDHHPRLRAQGLQREATRTDLLGRRERAVLAGILLPGSKADPCDPLGELAALAESARLEVVDSLVQKRIRLSAGYALGKGKLAELVERVQAAKADVVLFDNDLSPRQIHKIEDAVACKVIDRSELILDIFASRAKTREAQLQVELAQLQYTSPRIRGMWTHLERLAGAGGGTAAGAVGGVGTRGPGERQLEIDRRIVKDRITYLKREIEDIDRRKEREVRSRADAFTVCLVGYTNAGKSTLMNRLTRADRFAADLLFATLDTKTVRWALNGGDEVLLSDTVGFIRDLPHHLVASFRATLEEAIHADLLLHVIDASSPRAWQQMESVEEVLADLGCRRVPRLEVLNKSDLVNDASVVEMIETARPGARRVSALTGEGLDELAAFVRERMRGGQSSVRLLVSHREGRALPEIARLAEVRRRTYESEGVLVEARISPTHLRQLLGRFPGLQVVNGDEPPADGPSADESA